jgi:hypothetical protein
MLERTDACQRDERHVRTVLRTVATRAAQFLVAVVARVSARRAQRLLLDCAHRGCGAGRPGALPGYDA